MALISDPVLFAIFIGLAILLLYACSSFIHPPLRVVEPPRADANLWIVGQVTPFHEKEWEFVGVFDSEEKAVAECKDFSYFVGPVVLNSAFREMGMPWDGAYYPIAD